MSLGEVSAAAQAAYTVGRLDEPKSFHLPLLSPDLFSRHGRFFGVIILVIASIVDQVIVIVVLLGVTGRPRSQAIRWARRTRATWVRLVSRCLLRTM